MGPNPEFTAVVHRMLVEAAVHQRLRDRAAVVLERIARGGGATRWYYCPDGMTLDSLEADFRPGSKVSFYFDDRILRVPFSQELRKDIEIIVSRYGEAVVGVAREHDSLIDVEFVAGPTDLAEVMDVAIPAVMFIGTFPAPDNDGTAAITVTLPDSDGVVRDHPH